MITCNHGGFAWVWDFDQIKWLIDLEASGGPPSPHEPSPEEPPFTVTKASEAAIIVPKSLIPHFLKMAESCSDQMGNAGCNDFVMENTPENRELIEMAEAANLRMTLEQYRECDEYYEPRVMSNGQLITCDFTIFGLFVGKVKAAQ